MKNMKISKTELYVKLGNDGYVHGFEYVYLQALTLAMCPLARMPF